MPGRCLSPRTLLRDSLLLLIGTVMGILLSRAFFDVPAYRHDAFPGVSIQKRHPLGASKPACNDTRRGEEGEVDSDYAQTTARNIHGSAVSLEKATTTLAGAAGSRHATAHRATEAHPMQPSVQLRSKTKPAAGSAFSGGILDIGSPQRARPRAGSGLLDARAPLVQQRTRPKTLAEELGSTMRQPLLVGVVTSKKLLLSRAKAINNTWGPQAPKVIFFSSEGAKARNLPVVSLPGTDDTYPPQKKVYRMLKYMYDHYIDRFNWFMRADDDIYVRIDPLVKFLNSLDPSVDLYIGQPGLGKPEDLERIKLHPNERYCMGGPGVILSRSLLIKLGPHLEDCLTNVVVSWNEDLEVGRCIMRRLGVQCTWSYEVWVHTVSVVHTVCLES